MGKPQYETEKLLANQCPEHKLGNPQLIGNYPDVLVDGGFLIVPKSPLVNDGTWSGPLDSDGRPYILVKCDECSRVTVQHYHPVFGWRSIRQTWWRRRVSFTFLSISDGSFEIFSVGRYCEARLFFFPSPEITQSWWERKHNVPYLIDGTTPVYAIHEMFTKFRQEQIARLIGAYVQSRDGFRLTLSDLFGDATNTSDVLGYVLSVQQVERRLIDESTRATQAVLKAALYLHKGKDKNRKSPEEQALRLELAQLAKDLGADVPPELLVDSSSTKKKSPVEVVGGSLVS